jgi:hypothetical protein
MVVDKWRTYLLRKPFVIRTDHKSLCHLQDQSLSIEMQRKAMTKLAGLQFKLQYKRGPENSSVGALSRVGEHFQISAMSAIIPVWIQEVLNSYVVDNEAQQLMQELAVHSPNEQGYILVDGLIRYKGKFWVGSNTAVQTKIIQVMHGSALGGHSGIQATYQRVNRLFCWKGLKKSVDSFVRQCSTCQQAKHKNGKSSGLLSPLPIPQHS